MRAADATTIKTVVLPVEHGASVMLGESLLAGLLIAASGKGFLPAFGWLFFFLMGNPLKIAAKDIAHRVFTARTLVALWFCAGFGVLAIVFFAATCIFSRPSFLLLLAGVIPLGMVHLWAVVKAGKKEFAAELSGALSLGAAAASIVLAAGHSKTQALVLWMVLALRAMTSVVYVRERLSQSRGKTNNIGLGLLAHIAAMAVLGALVLAHLIKPLIILAGFLLTARLWPLYRCRPVSAKNLGLQESILGLVYVVLAVFSF